MRKSTIFLRNLRLFHNFLGVVCNFKELGEQR